MKQPYVSTLISQNFTSGEKTIARKNIDVVSSADVENQIESHISSLDYEDSPVSHQFVTSVSETDGIVSISRRQPEISDVDGLEDALRERLNKIQSDWDQTDIEKASYIKNKPENLVQDADYVHTDNNFTDEEKAKLSGIASGAEVNVQSDWTQTSVSADDYIKNKPENLVQDSAYVHTDNNFTDAEKTKLAGISSGAQVNVIDDVKVNGTSQTVTNKAVDITVPTKTSQLSNDSGFITASQVPADKVFIFRDTDFNRTLVKAAWDAHKVVQMWINTPHFRTILTKVETPDADTEVYHFTAIVPVNRNQSTSNPTWRVFDSQFVYKISTGTYSSGGDSKDIVSPVQSNWNQSDTTALDYIKNKPTKLSDFTDDIIFVANYSGSSSSASNTPFADIKAAYDAGKVVLLKQTVLGGDALYQLVTIDSSKALFTKTSGAFTSNNEYINTASTGVVVTSSNVYSSGSQSLVYSAGTDISISASNVISCTMERNCKSVMLSANNFATDGEFSEISFGKWRIKCYKKAMTAFGQRGFILKVAHADYSGGTAIGARIRRISFKPWNAGTIDDYYTGVEQFTFNGGYDSQGSMGEGFPVFYPDPNGSSHPANLTSSILKVDVGIYSPDCLEIEVLPFYVNSQSSLTNNAPRIILNMNGTWS